MYVTRPYIKEGYFEADFLEVLIQTYTQWLAISDQKYISLTLFFQENYQSIPPNFMALGFLVSNCHNQKWFIWLNETFWLNLQFCEIRNAIIMLTERCLAALYLLQTINCLNSIKCNLYVSTGAKNFYIMTGISQCRYQTNRRLNKRHICGQT